MKERVYIGVAWPYANGSLHLGHIAGCYLPADIFARYQRMKDKSVLMVSGSDEHGTPITIIADKEKTTPKVIVDRYHKEHVQNMNQMGISFDLFTRTTTKNHEKIVQDIFLTLYKKGYIYKKRIEAFYCKNCNKFLPDRYIEGSCPKCGSQNARGDQCDECGKLLDPQDLINIKCKICGSIPEIRNTDHLFFALSKFTDKLVIWMEDKKYWKPSVLKFTQNWLESGLQDRAITRDMEWGIKVPIKGFYDKRIYVWFDAVIGYLSASIEWSKKQGKKDEWEKWWKDSKALHYYFLAKDNIPFHTLIWPSILMGYNDKLNLAYDIPANEYLRLKGEQFSKSRSIAVWVPDILKNFDVDAVRYYLSINMPENRDTDWLWDDFVSKNNDELVGAYGNFVHRVITFTEKNFGKIPKLSNIDKLDKEALEKIKKVSEEISFHLDKFEFKKGLRAAMALAQFGNFYFDHKQPWVLVKNNKEACGSVLHICIKILKALSVFMAPYLPFSSDKIWFLIGEKGSVHTKKWDIVFDDLQVDFNLERPQPLFKKLDIKQIIKSEVDPFSKVDLRVAKIIGVKDHPEADKLYMLHIDLGKLGKRVIIAGIKPYYTPKEITGKSIVVVVNLKPVKIRGITSNGMLLAAADSKGTVVLLNPGDTSPGSEVTVKGVFKKPVSILELEDFKKIELLIDEFGKATYNKKVLRTEKTEIVSDKSVEKGAKIL